jgi:hypothetical protein
VIRVGYLADIFSKRKQSRLITREKLTVFVASHKIAAKTRILENSFELGNFPVPKDS